MEIEYAEKHRAGSRKEIEKEREEMPPSTAIADGGSCID
jgi:hypothetical protein